MTAAPAARIALDGDAWQVRAVDDAHVPERLRSRVASGLPARVPGAVHVDLIRAGVIPDPDLGFGEREQRWVGRTDWVFRRSFDVAVSGAYDLVAEGLDTVAFITIDGRPVGAGEAAGHAANMHHAHRFPVDLDRGRHTIEIIFAGPVTVAETEERTRGARPINGDWGPYAFLRKAAYTYGWDWGPCCPSVGIWRTLYLAPRRPARIAAVRPLVVAATAVRASIDVRVDVEGESRRVRATLTCPDGRVAAEAVGTDGTLRLNVERPRRWWPRGYGAPDRYRLDVVLDADEAGTAELDRWSHDVGLRTVRLVREPDAHGTTFGFEVNGVPVFAQGANWIPAALFPGAATPARIRKRVHDAAAAGMNMLRVWGGGVYEDAAFYDACDAHGLLVWQDFMFACSTYPEEAPYLELVRTEARAAVDRLSRHPSVVLWCGGNENLEALACWGWTDELARARTWGRRLFFETLPDVVAARDPSRSYWPDSPSSEDPQRNPRDPDHGDRHTWDAWGAGYRDCVPRFVSEFGHQSPPNPATLATALGHALVDLDDPGLHHRQRAGGGNAAQYDARLDPTFGPAPDAASWAFRAQLLQARSMTIALEWLRAHRPRCGGALLWQLNDVWSGLSWSLVDVRGRRKLAWYAVRRALRPRCLCVHPVDGVPTVFALNDTERPWRTPGRARLRGFDGAERSETGFEIDVPPRAAVAAATVARPNDAEGTFLDVAGDGERAVFCFVEDREQRRSPADLAVRVTRPRRGVRVAVTAGGYVPDLCLRPDGFDPDARVSTQLVTLTAGETVVFDVRTGTRPSDTVLCDALWWAGRVPAI